MNNIVNDKKCHIIVNDDSFAHKPDGLIVVDGIVSVTLLDMIQLLHFNMKSGWLAGSAFWKASTSRKFSQTFWILGNWAMSIPNRLKHKGKVI